MALHLEEDVKEEQTDERRLRISVSPVYDRLASRDQTPPTTCPILCGPRTCATLPPTLHKQGSGSSEPKKRRLWGLRGLVKMFRRRTRRKGVDSSESHHSSIAALRTRSASELAVDQSNNRSSSGPYNQGLSVSHDSVFSPESPTVEQRTSASDLALATRGVNMVELEAALRRRRTDDSGSPDDDQGLPQSPPISPNTFDVLSYGFKNSSRATQSSCSDASLLSTGSSEYDEDSFGSLSQHSSRASLIEGHNYSIDNEPAAGTVRLSHNAARHKMAVRPRRTHVSSKMRRPAPIPSSPLPTTIEVNEESILRSSECVKEETHTTTMNSKEDLPLKGEFHAREAVEALVVELVTEKSKSYFSRSFEEKRSSHVTSIDSSACGIPSINSIQGEGILEDLFNSNINKERNKSDPTSFSKRMKVGDSRSVVCSQRASSLEGLLGEAKSSNNYFVSQVLNNESQVQLRDKFSSSVDVISTSLISPQTPKSILYSAKVVESGISVLDQQNYNVSSPLPVLPDEHIKKLLGSLNSRESRSSIDNLTTTLLPGIYIRPFSPNSNADVTTDEGTFDGSDGTEWKSPCAISPLLGEGNVAPKDINTANDISPVSFMLPEETAQSPPESALGEARKVKREPSFTSQTEPVSENVPEFMRVHLNRVKSLNNPIVLNTSGHQAITLQENNNELCTSSKTREEVHPSSPVRPSRKDAHKSQEPVVEHNKITYKEALPIAAKDETAIQPSAEFLARPEPQQVEEVVLRRPSLLDNSVTLDQSSSADCSKKDKSDEPELLKVFARRSFKVKDSESEDRKPLEDSCKENICTTREAKKIEPKSITNAIKRYSIGSCPVPFGTRFVDANVTPKIPPLEAHQLSTNNDKSEIIGVENSSILSQQPHGSETVQNYNSSQDSDAEVLSKVAYPRRSLSHITLKTLQPKSSLGRTSSANQTDFACASSIINRSIASNAEKPKEIVDTSNDRRPTIDTKPTITTKPVIWPPVKSCSESPPKSSPVESNKPQPVTSSFANTTKTVSGENKSMDAGKDAEMTDHSNIRMPNRFSSVAPRKVTLAEAKNTSFSQSLIVENARKDCLNSKNELAQKPGNDEPAVDWRILVRKRREDRLKHTKSTDANEIIMETRPNTNRNSKVLEMANNFQKLQVA